MVTPERGKDERKRSAPESRGGMIERGRDKGAGIKILNRKKERLFLFFERNMEKNPVLDLSGIARLLIHL
jgi:hypothetical protein